MSNTAAEGGIWRARDDEEENWVIVV